jgi:hypothetical protein
MIKIYYKDKRNKNNKSKVLNHMKDLLKKKMKLSKIGWIIMPYYPVVIFTFIKIKNNLGLYKKCTSKILKSK